MFRRLSLWLVLVGTASRATASDCPKLLPKLLERISPVSSARRSYLNGKVHQGIPSFGTPEKVQERSWASFLERLVDGHEDRMFFVFTPSGREARVATGHLNLFVRDTLFGRVPDEWGAEALSSRQRSLAEMLLWSWVRPKPQELLKSFNFEAPYALVHEIDISPQSSQTLHRFFHDRVWFHHAGHADYRKPYEPLPFSRPRSTGGENCVTFAFSFLDPYWMNLKPDLKAVASDLGETWVDEIPLRQAELMMSHPKRRASYWIRLLDDGQEMPALDQFSSLIP